MKSGPVVQEMLFKIISYLIWSSGGPLIQQSRTICNFHRGYYKEQFCETGLNLDQWFRRKCPIKIFLILSSGGPFVQWGGTICAILVEGIKRNNSVK